MKIPQYLHKPMQVLWWESDEFTLMFMFLLLGLMMKWYFLIPAFLLPWLYSYLKNNYPRGYTRHFLYFIGIKDFYKYPTAFEKEFIE